MENRDNKFLKGLLTGISCSILTVVLAFGIYYVLESRGIITGLNLSGQESDSTGIMNKVNLLEKYIDKYYLDEVDSEELANGIYKGVLSGLGDPYSTYYTQDEYLALMESSKGIYCGIGAYVSQDVKTGVITIVKPFENGPAYEAGMLPGDVLYKVADTEVTGEDLTEVVGKMKGEEGTTIEVSVIRDGNPDPIVLTITRRQIEVPTISYEMLDNNVGYISVSEFDKITATQFREAVDQLEKDGMVGLVVDLRNNPGGLLDTVVNMLDRVIDKGLLIYTKDKNGNGEKYNATDDTSLKVPLTVLINGNSASASEVFAGAIQDYGVGTLVGTTSFGKGIVQSILPLSDGTAVKLTVSKYYTPNGRNIHKTGITPDVEVELDSALKQQVKIEKSEDNQLQEAVKIILEQNQ